MGAPSGPVEPGADCGLCPRLADFRQNNRTGNPGWHNAPVASFGGLDGELLIVGLAPGLRGANMTGRPFTGDYAGDLLYASLKKFGFSEGRYGATAGDGLKLVNCRITNAVRCVPPENKPVGAEVAACRPFLQKEIAALPRLRVILALGTLSHGAVLAALGEKKSAYKFGHNQFHDLKTGDLILADSYHCSRYNTNTRKLTESMFESVFEDIQKCLSA
ncbi:MAG: uracil-DNA glycosylase [Rhodospirillales bacterium]|nr:uracil-DNA glycosylase [Alphaproteobacteria bacterium]MBL6947779.1 uracil-DNA glycosylase [Rhodospirillales bacterium]